MKRTIMILIALLTLTLPVATLANDDEYNSRNSRNDDDHERFYRALERGHRNFHQYNRIDCWEDRIRLRRFHRYLEARHRRVHQHFCEECRRLQSMISHYNRYNDDDDWNNRRHNTEHDHH